MVSSSATIACVASTIVLAFPSCSWVWQHLPFQSTHKQALPANYATTSLATARVWTPEVEAELEAKHARWQEANRHTEAELSHDTKVELPLPCIGSDLPTWMESFEHDPDSSVCSAPDVKVEKDAETKPTKLGAIEMPNSWFFLLPGALDLLIVPFVLYMMKKCHTWTRSAFFSHPSIDSEPESEDSISPTESSSKNACDDGFVDKDEAADVSASDEPLQTALGTERDTKKVA